jgi:hypothetical protein
VSTLTTTPSAPSALSRLGIPARLPDNHRGEPLRHLSYSAVSRFRGCPEDYRRSYMLGEWGPKSGEMFLGSRVDDALSGYFRQRIDGSTLGLDAVKDLYNERWKTQLAEEAQRNGPVRFSTARNCERAHAIGLEAIELAMRDLVPHVGRPTAVQRSFEFKLHPQLEWSIIGTIDIETIREQTVYLLADGSEHPAIREHGHPEPLIALPYSDAPAEWRQPVKRGKETLEPREAILRFEREAAEHEERLSCWLSGGEDGPEPKAPKALPEVNVPVSELTAQAVRRELAGLGDFKVTTKPFYESSASYALQPGIYLGARWVAGDPAFDFRFLQIALPSAGGRVNMGHLIVPTRRSEAQLRTTFMRIAQTANMIWAAYRYPGPNERWGASTEDWRCRKCNHGPWGTKQCPLALAV